MSDERFDAIDRRFDQVDGRLDELRRHMGVLHEETLDRIAAVSEGFPRLEAKMDRNMAELKELIGRRLEPLEAAVRHHSLEIERLKQSRAD